MPVYTAGKRGGVSPKNAATHPDWIHHCEPMAGWHVRDGNHGGLEDDGVTPLKKELLGHSIWAYELHLSVTCESFTPKGSKAPRGPVPRIALGMAWDAPAKNIGENSLASLVAANEVRKDLKVKPGIVVADGAILPNSLFVKLQKPARAMGFKLAMKYGKLQTGQVTSKNVTTKKNTSKSAGQRGTVADQTSIGDPMRGFKMVDGDVLCPGVPQHLIDAESLFNDKKIDKATRDDMLDERADYRAVRHETWNAESKGRFGCPALNPGGKLTCPVFEREPRDKPRIEVENPPAKDAAGEACTAHQKSLQLTLDDRFGHFASDVYWRSGEHDFMMRQRNVVEGFNATLKEEDHENLNDGSRRRVRGYAKQALFAAIMVFSANVRAISVFIDAYDLLWRDEPINPGPDTPQGPDADVTALADEGLPPPDQLAA